MAECPGVLHLAVMRDGALARIRVPGGAMTAAQTRAVADVTTRLGSGFVEVTNRANLQVRGLARDAGPFLVGALEAAGFRFAGEADRRRNVLLDPMSGLDPAERRDLRSLGAALDDALIAAPWIGGLSPKFSFVLDGGGASRIAAVPSDVVAFATHNGVLVIAGQFAARAETDCAALAAMIAIARMATSLGEAARARDLAAVAVRLALAQIAELSWVEPPSLPSISSPPLGVRTTGESSLVTVAIPVPVGRLDAAMLRFLAEAAERDGEGRIVLSPWSAVVLPGVSASRAQTLLARSEAAGFTPVAVAERLSVTACAGAPACERAREPAKALGAAILALAAAEPGLMPPVPARLHLSACAKGCAGSAAADLLMLGSSERVGWSLHRDASPRASGPPTGRLEAPESRDVLSLLRQAVEA